jgi:hypothetical protein
MFYEFVTISMHIFTYVLVQFPSSEFAQKFLKDSPTRAGSKLKLVVNNRIAKAPLMRGGKALC